MAVTLQDVENTFKSIIEISPIDNTTEVIPFSTGFVPSATFASLFANAQDMTSTSLLAIDDQNKYGYSTIIDEWKAIGVIA